jgi:hypothetical protein
MWGRVGWLASVLIPAVMACTDVNTDPQAVVAVSLDSVATPSVVAGDTLRDTLGVVRGLRGSAYNYLGKVLQGYAVKYRAIDLGLHVDSLTGIVVADTARTLPVRVLAEAGGIQTQPTSLFIVPQPYQVLGVDTTGFLASGSVTYSAIYSPTDTTPVLSPALTVRILPQDTVRTTVPIQGYLVSYQIQPLLPTDTSWAHLVNGSGQLNAVDTTGSLGTAGQFVQIRPLKLPAVTDSVVVLATVRYHGVVLLGSPVRFVLQVKPPPVQTGS